ncbi:NAD-dependent succinate-semialdehyde dehydrogenase [Altererythrobacter sp. Root672]|uniref:NAD-dependent succinate-semialdehyde dehydrogenase n=1 Tax=Altererythrobacter sp. Root672 TaxID=1736584 RepID=UPI001F177696|nr:NAD-dependent succinate-semialdehyde dehydrogenase [Altererythrobacter sp. Root672]
MPVLNPANGDVVASVRTYSETEIDEIIRKADAARHDWAAVTAKERSAILRAWFDLIILHREELAEICTRECGKPLAEARTEVDYAASFVEWYSEEAKRAYGETIPSFAVGKSIVVTKEPVGTCAAITPWNFPLAMITRKSAPALAAGCAIVIKPSEATPLSALALEALAVKAGIPTDVLRIVPSDDAPMVGKLFCTHPTVRKISFTGSTAIGKLLLEQAGSTVKRVSMELGGNAPFIVFGDADVDAAVDGAMIAKFRNAGQSCIGANRMLVQRDVHDLFVEKFVARVSALKVANGLEEGAQIGPLITDTAFKKVESLTDLALSQGASLAWGGSHHNAGAQFYTPTVLTGVAPDMDIARQEIFGPVASITSFQSEDEALRLANDTRYGLASYFYTRDIGRVARVMRELEYGMVAVNEGLLGTEVAPFGGIKESGLGREGSRHGMDEYLELKYGLIGGLGT